MSNCLGCAIAGLQIAMLKNQVRQQQNRIKRLEQIIINGRVECDAIMRGSNKVMSEHCPRGTWSLAKGAGAAASRVKSKLG